MSTFSSDTNYSSRSKPQFPKIKGSYRVNLSKKFFFRYLKIPLKFGSKFKRTLLLKFPLYSTGIYIDHILGHKIENEQLFFGSYKPGIEVEVVYVDKREKKYNTIFRNLRKCIPVRFTKNQYSDTEH